MHYRAVLLSEIYIYLVGLLMDPLAHRIALKWALRYVPKETKQHKVERLTKVIRDATGLSKSLSEGIADAYVRGRDVSGLALQKNWPIDHGVIEGPNGSLELRELSVNE